MDKSFNYLLMGVGALSVVTVAVLIYQRPDLTPLQEQTQPAPLSDQPTRSISAERALSAGVGESKTVLANSAGQGASTRNGATEVAPGDSAFSTNSGGSTGDQMGDPSTQSGDGGPRRGNRHVGGGGSGSYPGSRGGRDGAQADDQGGPPDGEFDGFPDDGPGGPDDFGDGPS